VKASPDAARRLTLPRRKPRRLSHAVAFRLVRAARAVVPRNVLARGLLELSWLSHRLAWEEVWVSGEEDRMRLLRPGSIEWVVGSIRPGERVVDLGGGNGVIAHAAAQVAAEVVYVDRDPKRAEVARDTCAGDSNVRILVGDGLDVLAREDGFDVAVLLHLVEHLDEPEEALAALRGHCARLVVEVPDFDSEPLNHARLALGTTWYRDADHVSEFTAASLRATLERAGWSVDELVPEHGMLRARASQAASRAR
jgi:SAM-dependent methyltransferase